MDIAYIKSAFVTLFVAVDPLGLATIFLGLTAHMTLRDQRSTAFRSVIIAFCILVAAGLGGQPLLEMLGIGMPAFRIAGGLLLFSIAAEMVFERREDRKAHTAEAATKESIGKIAAFPLAIPLMAGPGAITATILLASAAQHSWMDMLLLLAILFAVMLCCLIVFLLATPLNRLLGTIGKVVFSRLLGILLAAMAVQIIGDGVLAFSHMIH